jgi:hypothetical protein
MTLVCEESCPWCGKQVLCDRKEIGAKDQLKPSHTTHCHSLTLNGKTSHYRNVGKDGEYRVKMVFGYHEWAKKSDGGLKYDPNPKREIF